MYQFANIFKHTIWGGNRITRMKNVDDMPYRVGESWEISAIPGCESVVADGPDAGLPLSQLISKYGADLMGKHVFETCGTCFPLLVKFIDANDNLSIQVHPDDETAQQRHHSSGKTEMWYVMESAPDASILVGFDHDLTRQQFTEAVKNQEILSHIRLHQVKEGDAFFLPAGRVHSIGSGTLLAEIQQSSDITYRIYDYGRVGDDGKPRALHTELAADVLDLKAHPDYRTHYEQKPDEHVCLADCRYFRTNLLDIDKPLQISYADNDSFVILMCVDSKAELSQQGGIDANCRTVSQGQTLLIPASAEKVSIQPDSSCRLLEITIP